MRPTAPVAVFVFASASLASAQPVNTAKDAIAAIESAEALEAASSQGPSPPRPASNPGTWIHPEDYPSWAAAYDVGGTVTVLVDVDAEGAVVNCAVREGSGIADLDRLACEKITERARFVPARDAEGNRAPNQWQNQVVWVAPEAQDVAFENVPEPGELTVNMVIERDGTVSKCAVERATGGLALPGAQSAFCANLGPFQPLLGADGKPERRRIRLRSSIEHLPAP